MKRVLVLIAFCSMIHTASYAAETAQSAPSNQITTLQSIDVNSIREFGKNGLMHKTPLTTDKLAFNTYFIAPRQILPLHWHPASDELFYIVEGRGQFTVDNHQIMVSSGSAIYGPMGVPHGIVNSGKSDMVVISVQAPTPVQIKVVENSTLTCPSCGQEDILPTGAKEGDIYVCPRCGARLKLSKTKDGKWVGTQIE